ncbi:P-loop containing nucleoside triphosphate hydrolase protein [Cokeromyces recurvatus]|uniref:P-loop containing nucleoside triphosphate hydrolase protein n=1 Tax=Cokeromyces recurvatus TaxID=90255 RepID=UPI00221EE1AF|nr:P-loop containing nucleoside triphosphate hydrolase protein [Cokeromyces recurvatus]KAI7898310.1 P-loop containing nucleoside triphosphate hydrolase protein [Cokeromyces recurvatus]
MVKSTKNQTANTKPLKPNNNKKKVFKKNKSVNKQPKLEKGVSGEIEYEELGDIDSWDWNESVNDTFVSDELGGFLCLEEISDVEIEYEGDDATGKVAKFKRIKKEDRKKGKKAEPTAPLSLEETKKYYDLDTFDEELATKEEGMTEENTSEEKTEEGEKNESTDNEIKENSITKEPAKDKQEQQPVEKKTKAQKLLEKKKKELERLQTQVKQLEEQAKNETEVKQLEEQAKNETQEGEKKPMNKRERLAAKRKAQEEEEKKKEQEKKPRRPTLEDVDQTVDISAWDDLSLSEPIKNALKYNHFTSPTPIQKNALPLALKGRDIIGSAETGSGKTLAFGIPIINYLANHPVHEGLTGLILTPTRELAIQVRDHIESMAVFSNTRVIAIVGGMSVQKQERLLNQKPDIIVATPGRLWELLSGNSNYMDMLKHIKFLVLDEADRMLEKGHFDELNSVLDALSSKRQNTTEWPEEVDGDGINKKKLPRHVGVHQTFIYTATLSKDIRFNVKAKKKKSRATTNTMEDLLERIDFADKEPALVDMTSENVVASRLLEAKVDCVNTDKDLYVYYFVTRYPGRTIIFVNSIDAIRRLVPVFKLLHIEVLGLHAQMQQKQRLKNLDRFKANPKAVLVASDVAARGLDIPLVDHVIHYQLPRSGEIYVHRSGRTARANHDGISLLLCSPEEVKIYNKLCQTLRKNKQYPEFPVDLSILRAMRERVKLASEIDSIQHQESKQSHEVNWMRNMAKEMDVEFDEETMQGKGHQKSEEQLQKAKMRAKALKHELEEQLKQPILPAGVSTKFLTGGVINDLVERLLMNDTQKVLPGSSNSKAVEDLHSAKKRKTKH